MTDDIVIRLREGCSECSHEPPMTACVLEAADEIERLRTELSETQTQCLYWREIALEHDLG